MASKEYIFAVYPYVNQTTHLMFFDRVQKGPTSFGIFEQVGNTFTGSEMSSDWNIHRSWIRTLFDRLLYQANLHETAQKRKLYCSTCQLLRSFKTALFNLFSVDHFIQRGAENPWKLNDVVTQSLCRQCSSSAADSLYCYSCWHSTYNRHCIPPSFNRVNGVFHLEDHDSPNRHTFYRSTN